MHHTHTSKSQLLQHVTPQLLSAMAHKSDCLTIAHQNPVRSVTFSPDEKMVAAGSCSKTGTLLGDLSNYYINQIFWSVAFSPCNQGKAAVPVLAAGCNDGDVYLWDCQTPACKSNAKPDCKLTGHIDRVRSVAYTENDKELIVSGSDDHSIRL